MKKYLGLIAKSKPNAILWGTGCVRIEHLSALSKK